jgi:hypothetical protein
MGLLESVNCPFLYLVSFFRYEWSLFACMAVEAESMLYGRCKLRPGSGIVPYGVSGKKGKCCILQDALS